MFFQQVVVTLLMAKVKTIQALAVQAQAAQAEVLSVDYRGAL
jgi:hypothetical protein